jgi:hypothetical protein
MKTTRHKAHRAAKPGYCEATGKRRFRDPREATQSLQHLQNLAHQMDEDGRPHRIRVVRKYRCEACQGWHLTSWKTPFSPTLVEDRIADAQLMTSAVAA